VDQTIRIAKRSELDKVLKLLESLDLPGDGVEEHLDEFLVAEEAGRVIGAVGLEVYGSVGLLRSLAVEPLEQSGGLGSKLVESLLERARDRKIEALYLLTTTADRYFPRFGFEPIPRAEVDPRLGDSKELQRACPQTAVCMRLRLQVE
jgi:amino-acid N-acetyltransferase